MVKVLWLKYLKSSSHSCMWNQPQVLKLKEFAGQVSYFASSWKQHPAGRHVTQLGYIIKTLNKPIIALYPICHMSGREAVTINFKVVEVIQSRIKSTKWALYHKSTITKGN